MSTLLKEVLNEALPIITKFAPNIGSVLGGAPGYAGGLALSLLAKAFNANPSDFRGLSTSIVNDPLAENKLAAVEEEHGLWLKSLIDDVKNPTHIEINIKMDWAVPSSGT